MIARKLKSVEQHFKVKQNALQRAQERWGVRAGIQQALLIGNFPATTHTFNSGTSVTETVPAGASFLRITVYGGGGAGSALGGGGGGGGQCISVGIVVTGGQTLTYTVGVGGSAGGFSGNSSTVVGVGALSAISLTAIGGAAGTAAGGAGGGAVGGNNANNSGQTGGVPAGGNNGAGVNGGNPGGVSPGGGSAGTSGTIPGGNGQIIFQYT